MMDPKPNLAEAMLVWTGFGTRPFPCRDESRLVDHFGAETAAQLLPVLRSLEDDFYASDARHTAEDIQEMATVSSQQFRKRHPEVAEEIVKALAWCYTYDYK